MTYAIGVDIGGTKIASVIIDEQNNILHKHELKSIPDNRNDMFKQVVKSIDLVLSKSNIPSNQINGMGVGVPGKVDKQKGLAIYQNNLPWRNFPLVQKLQDYYELENVQIDNDVYLAALAEWSVSNIETEDTFVYITVSTGVSCATIHNGSFIRGAGFAGEIGLFPVLANTFPDGWNRLEKTVSGPATEKMAQKLFNEPNLTTEEFFTRFQEGCSKTTSIIENFTDSLAHGIYSIICLLDPQKIVFGGGVMNNNPYLLDLINSSLKKHVIPEQHAQQRLQISHFKENAGVVGAGLMGLGLKGKYLI